MLRRIQKKKERRNKILMGGVLVFLMVFSLMGVIMGNQGSTVLEYNGFKFEQSTQGFYTTKINKEEVAFNYLPPSLKNFEVSEKFEDKIFSSMMYMTFDPESDQQNLVYMDVVRHDLSQKIDSLIVSGVTKESEVYNLPVFSCDNATEYVSVIYFNVSDTTSIIDKDECLVLNGQTTEFFKLRDYILYTYYGVFDDEE